VGRLLIAASVLTVSYLPMASECDARPVPAVLCEHLEDHGELAKLPDQFDVLQLLFRLGSPSADARGKLVLNPGRLAQGPRTLPSDVTSNAGYYIGVTSAEVPGRYAFLVRLADPSHVVGETADQEGKIEGHALRRNGGLLSTRVPFVSGGRLIVCEVTPGGRTVLVDEDLGPGPFPADGRDFKAREKNR
jgi:hypothetical protein